LRIGHIEDATPLTPQQFYILLAIAKEPDNAYGLLRKIAEDSGESVKLASGSLYPSLKRLLQAGYIEKAEPMPSAGRLGETSVYRLTDVGKMLLTWELDRYNRAVDLGRERLRML
jgi:DNA-binding PadR family transcriptional regulator